jgi:hypothetical protein
MPEMEEFLDDMETEECNLNVIINMSKTQSHTADPTVLKLLALMKEAKCHDLALMRNMCN